VAQTLVKAVGMRDIDVVVIGELNVDLILQGDVTPAFGQAEKLIDDATLTLGSSSAIFACGAARLGLRVAFVGKVGDDEFGGFVLRGLAARKIDTSQVVVDPTIKTGLSVILSRSDDRAILTHPGSISALRLAEIDQSIFRRARHLHLGSYFLLEALRPDIPALFRQARALGLSTSLDTNYDPAETWDSDLAEVLPHTVIFLPNETELGAITGRDDLQAALSALIRDVSIVAAKLGPEGALARQGEDLFQAEALPVSVVDTTGAGDTFDAGFIYGYLAGWDISRTLRFACVCGSLSTRAAGGTTAQPSLSEALAAM
jgi:sugar/nucleoside kinase (ribokinase family)